jgi:HPt (histidine-containing phosphotransfer) domain-containing protein
MVEQSLYKLIEQERAAHKTIKANLEKKNEELSFINEQLKDANKNLQELVQHPDIMQQKNLRHPLRKAKKLADDKPLYDLSKLQAISRGNEQFIQKMLRVFRNESIAAVQQIKEAYNNNDVEKIKTTAHRIKPSVYNMGISSLTEYILQLESFDITTNSKDVLLSLISKLDEVINKVVMQLEENVLI